MQWNDTEIRGEIDPQRLAIVLKNGSNDVLKKAVELAREGGLRPEVLSDKPEVLSDKPERLADKTAALQARSERIAPSDRLLWVTAPDAYSRRKDLAERVARIEARVAPVFIGALGAGTLFSRFTVDPWVVDVHPIGIRTLLLLGHGVEIERHWPVGGWFRARLEKPVDDFVEFAKSLRKMARVSFRSYPLILPVAAPTPDTTEPKYLDGTQWNLARIRSPQMWGCGTGTTNVKVFVVDTGVVAWDPEIELDAASVNIDMDLGGGVYGGTGRPVGNDGHGTNAAGIIGAKAASTGIAGLAPECTLVSLRCLDGTLTEVFQAVNYAVTQLSSAQRGVVYVGFDVLKLYANGVADASLLVSALNTAQAHDLTVVIPSGNYTNPVTEGDTIPAITPLTAATKPYVIVTGASIRNNANPSQEGRLDNTGGEPGSRYGAELSIVAPGTDIYSTTAPVKSYAGSLCGTCIAAAHVAGTAAIIRSLATGMSAPDVKTLLLATATQVTGPLPAYAYAATALLPRAGYRNNPVGTGRLDAGSAAMEAHAASGPLTIPAGPAMSGTPPGSAQDVPYIVTNTTPPGALPRTARVRLDLVRHTGTGSHSLFSFDPTSTLPTTEFDVAPGTSQTIMIHFVADANAPSDPALADLVVDSNDVRATPGGPVVRSLVAPIQPSCQCF